jgi:hypothetical protein
MPFGYQAADDVTTPFEWTDEQEQLLQELERAFERNPDV